MQRRIRRPGELSNQRITPYLVRYAAVGFDGFGEAVESILNALMSECLIELDERSRAHHIGVQEDGELSRQTFFLAEEPFLELGRTRNSIA